MPARGSDSAQERALAPRRPVITRLLPPAGSLAVHALLVVALLVVSRFATPGDPPRDEVLAEVDLRAFATDRPAREPPSLEPITPPQRSSEASPDRPAGSTPRQPAADPGPASQADALASVTSRALEGSAPGPASRAFSGPGASGGAASAVVRNAGASPSASFAGLSARAAADVVYVVDASGAVVTSFSLILSELQRSIERLSPTQRVQVVLFRERAGEPGALVFANGSLVRATPSTKRALLEWVEDIRPAGRSNPAEGLTRALELEPDLVFFLSSSIERTNSEWGAGRDAILTRLDVLNPPSADTAERPIVIKTIQFMRDDPSGLMRDIAQRHGDGASSYRLLTLDDLDAPASSPDTALLDAGGAAPDLSPAEALAAIEADASALRVLAGIATSAELDRVARASGAAFRQADASAADPASLTLRARAAVLALASDETDRAAARALRAILPKLSDAALLDPDADAARRLTVAAARALLGDPQPAAAELTALLADAQQIQTSPELLAEARLLRLAIEPDARRRPLLLADLERARTAPPFQSRGEPDAFWQALANEAIVRERLRSVDVAPSDLALLGDADTFNAAADRLPPSADTLDAWSAAPPALALLRAAHWARNPATSADAIALLERLTRSDAAGDALWELAVAYRLAGDDARAAEALGALAAGHADHPRALDALAAAADAIAARPHAPDANPDANPGAAPDIGSEIDVLVLAIRRLPEGARTSAWCLALAQRVPGPSRLEILHPIASDDPAAAEATPLVLDALALIEPSATPPDLRVSLLEAHRHAERLARAHASARWPRVALRGAAHELDAGDAERAHALLTDLEQLEPNLARTPSAVLLYASAELATGREASAGERLSALAARLEPAPGERAPEAFWHAWTLLLESAGPGDPRARAHLARLRLIDPALGGEPWRSRLESVARRAADAVHSPT